MCDYSLEMIASRPAAVGDRLISTNFDHTISRGFAAPSEPGVAVCLLPGTEIAFDRDVEYQVFLSEPNRTKPHRVARFRHVNEHEPRAHHDALEFPDGDVIMLTRLAPGQAATVLQLPANAVEHGHAQETPELVG
jgi:hypothetical protein